MVDFTVAIPTYNGENRLPEVLDRLRSQIDADPLSWEVIVVDNNSSDGTAKVVQDYQANWPINSPLKYCFEPRQGAAFARQQAVIEARGKYIGFLDDDNLPASNWVAAAYMFGETHPDAGAFGSRIQGDYEVTPSEEFKKIACYLAIIERGSKPRLYQPEKRMFPPGAGLVVLREAWLEAVPERLFLNNVGREAGLASEDLEAVLHIQKAGWELWYNPEMQVHHKIPRWRLERDYLVSVFRCIGLSSHHIRMLSFAAWQRPFAFLMYLANDSRKLVLHFLKHRKTIKNDLVAACEMELLVNSIVSPFFLWKKRLLRI